MPVTLTPSKLSFLREKYPKAEDFLAIWTPDKMYQYTADEERAVMADKAPTLAELDFLFGRDKTIAWLYLMLLDVINYFSVGDGMTEYQCKNLGESIISSHPQLKASEVMLFFKWFKSARYGRFYGKMDPMVIMDGLAKFRWDINDIRAEYNRKVSNENLTKDRENVITYEEFLRLHPEKADILNKLKQSLDAQETKKANGNDKAQMA